MLNLWHGVYGPDGKLVPDTRMVEARERADSATGSIIVNQTLADERGWKDAVGRRVRMAVNNGVVSCATLYPARSALHPGRSPGTALSG